MQNIFAEAFNKNLDVTIPN